MYSRHVFSFVLAITVSAIPAIAQDTDKKEAPQDERAAIEQRAQSYAAAYNAKDLKGLLAHWSPEGVYIDRASGESIAGREALEKTFQAELESAKESRMEIAVEAIEFVSPSVALEQGTATITTADSEPLLIRYSAVQVKRDGQWLIDRISEREVVVPPSHYEKLKPLEWMIGQWVDAGEGFTIDITCQWTTNQNFISRRYTVSNEDDVEMSGLQIIGWDAKKKEIRSWLFDSDGGMVKGTWRSRDGDWVVQAVATLADGATGSFTSIFRPTDDGNYTWRKINRVLDGRLLPNIDEVLVLRK